jgi:DNA replication protein DnaC
MLNQPTLQKLNELKLTALADAWAQQQASPDVQSLSFDERLGLLVDAQWLARENKRLDRLLKEAKLRISQACIEDIKYGARRELDKAQIRQLASCLWIQGHQNVLVTGMTGTGKTFIGCALAQQACRKGYRVLYRRTSRLFEELALARADGSYARLLDRFSRMDVLVLDDWGMASINSTQRHDLLEILEDRYGTRSTLITSQLPTHLWHEQLGDPTLADAILDRLIHNAHRIVLKGPSQRKEEATDP